MSGGAGRREHGGVQAKRRGRADRPPGGRGAASRADCRQACSTSSTAAARRARHLVDHPPSRRHRLHRIECGRHDDLPPCASSQAMRPVLAEMGGKNPAFVTASADLEVAASGVARSAFGLSGPEVQRLLQEVYVARGVHGRLPAMRWRETHQAHGRRSRRHDVFMGPVIDARRGIASSRRAQAATRPARSSLAARRCAAIRSIAAPTSQPTIVAGLPTDHRINRDELFLPFLSVLPLDDLDEAIADANRSAFGLTAGIYTQDARRSSTASSTPSRPACFMPTARAARRPVPGPASRPSADGRGRASPGKGGLGSWYVPQFMREQSHTAMEG